MNLFNRLFKHWGPSPRQSATPPEPSRAGAGASIDKGRLKTKAERDLRRVTEEEHRAADRQRRSS